MAGRHARVASAILRACCLPRVGGMMIGLWDQAQSLDGQVPVPAPADASDAAMAMARLDERAAGLGCGIAAQKGVDPRSIIRGGATRVISFATSTPVRAACAPPIDVAGIVTGTVFAQAVEFVHPAGAGTGGLSHVVHRPAQADHPVDLPRPGPGRCRPRPCADRPRHGLTNPNGKACYKLVMIQFMQSTALGNQIDRNRCGHLPRRVKQVALRLLAQSSSMASSSASAD